jgi:hypothetical protein
VLGKTPPPLPSCSGYSTNPSLDRRQRITQSTRHRAPKFRCIGYLRRVEMTAKAVIASAQRSVLQGWYDDLTHGTAKLPSRSRFLAEAATKRNAAPVALGKKLRRK